nr:unnamed protein product [Callosobruchus chinensis]
MSAEIDKNRETVGTRTESAGRQLKLRNTSSSIVLPCAEEEARIWKLSRRREDREAIWDKTSKNHHNSLLLTKLWKEVAVECNTTVS